MEYVYLSATLKRYDYIAPLRSTTASDDAFSRQIPQSDMMPSPRRKTIVGKKPAFVGVVACGIPQATTPTIHFSYLLYMSCSYSSRLFLRQLLLPVNMPE